MGSEYTLNPNESMNTENQLVDSTLFIRPDPSFGNTLDSTKESIGVNVTSNLLEGALFIVSSGSNQQEDIPSYWQHPVELLTHIFDDVVSQNDYPQYFYQGLIEAYADLYSIDLHLIVYNNNTYVIIDKSNSFESHEELSEWVNHAFIWCNADNTLYSPLFINRIDGHILTVFKTDEVFAWRCIESFIGEINQQLANTDQNHIEQHLNSPEEDLNRMPVDDPVSSRNHSTSLTALQPESTLSGYAFIQHRLQQIYESTNILKPQLDPILLENKVSGLNIANLGQLSPQTANELMQQQLMLISEVFQMVFEPTPQHNDTIISSNIIAEDNNHQGNTVQLNETNHFEQTDQNFSNVQLPVPPHLSNTTQVPQVPPAITPTQLRYDAPEILIQPKSKWHYRNIKDLGKKSSPLLAGQGPQRTPIKVKVPLESAYPIHLGVKILTYDDREHRSKIPVPEHTSVNMNSFSNDNNLNRLQFDGCNQMDYFDPVNRYVYSAISPAEHGAQRKDVRIHMFNLYQNGSVTREIIETEQLGKCKLAFWFCTLENGVYRPISPPSLSCLIEES